MAFLLHFSGPSSFEQTVALKPKTPAVVVGRDPEAAVYLPDTERLISRRHLSIEWTEAGAKLTVLSANGINTDHGDYFSGDEVVLADGESARIGSFSLIVSAEQEAIDLDATSFSGMGTRPVPTGPVTRAAPEKEQEKDPWADLLAQHAPKPPPPADPVPSAPLPMQSMPSTGLVIDDPFSSSTSWRMADDAGAHADPFSVSFAGRSGIDPSTPAAPAAVVPAPAQSAQAENAALRNLCRGLGVEAPHNTANFDWERFGASVRHVIQCLSDHLGSRIDTKRELRAEDRTMLGSKEINPLKAGMGSKEMVQYLLFTPDGVGGYAPANKALQEMAEEARSHETAVKQAAKGLAEGALKEFEPGKLRGVLLKGKISITSLVDNARLWDLYATHFEKKAAKPGEWSDQLFNRYYMAAYLREVEKLRRARMPAPPQRTE